MDMEEAAGAEVDRGGGQRASQDLLLRAARSGLGAGGVAGAPRGAGPHARAGERDAGDGAWRAAQGARGAGLRPAARAEDGAGVPRPRVPAAGPGVATGADWAAA